MTQVHKRRVRMKAGHTIVGTQAGETAGLCKAKECGRWLCREAGG
jgi:hypothetical protein